MVFGLILLASILPLFIIPFLSEIYIYPKITFLSCSLALLIFLWAIRSRFSPKLSLFSSPFFCPILLFFSVNVLSLIRAVNIYEGIYQVLWLFTYVMLFLLAVNNLDIAGIKKIIEWSIIGGVIVSALGIAQFWGLRISFLPIQLGSTLGTKNMSAQYIALILPLSAIGFFSHREIGREIFYGLAGAIMAIFLVYTQSRGSWMGVILAFIFILILLIKSSYLPNIGRFLQARKRKINILLMCSALVIVGVILPHFIEVPGVADPEEFVERFQSIFGFVHPSIQSRLAMWANTLEMIKDHYLLGVGVGNWKFIYPVYSRSRVVDPTFTDRTQPGNAHNDWVQMPAEIGLGFISFLWLILVAYRIGWKVLVASLKSLSENTHYEGLSALFFLFSISALLINAFFDFPFAHPVPLFYFWMLLGFLQIINNRATSWLPSNKSKKSQSPPGPDKDGWKGALAVLPFWISFFVVFIFAFMNIFSLKASYHFREGMILLKTGNLSEAITQAEKATSLDPTNSRYYMGLGQIYFAAKQYQQAAIAAKVALLNHPNSPNAWNNLGLSSMAVGQFLDAEQYFKNALRIYPDYYLAHLNLGNIYAVIGEKDKASTEYLAALSIKPDSREILDRLEALEKPR